MSAEGEALPEQREAEGSTTKAAKEQFLNPEKADSVSQGEFQKKYGFVKKPITPRKISSGGKQYFDSGDYNMEASKTHRKEIAAHPRAMNPNMAQMRMKATITKTQPSKLTSSQGSPPALASRVARASPLAQ